MNFNDAPEFKKDVKTLGKRVKTLKSDIKRALPKLESLYVKPEGLTDEQWTDYKKNFFDNKRAAKLKGYPDGFDVIKLRVDTDTLQYKDKLRLVCVVVVSGKEIILVELYSKNDKKREDGKRVSKYVL